MGNDWWADVGGQIIAGVVVVAIAGLVAALTPWGKRTARALVARIGRGWRMLRSIRVTTQSRIEDEIAAAAQRAVAAAPKVEAHTVQGGWVLGPAPEPRHWELRNQTGATAIVLAILPAGPYWPFEWEDPELPVPLAPGEALRIRARRISQGNHLMPFVNDAMANVLYEDDHGDEREDVISILN